MGEVVPFGRPGRKVPADPKRARQVAAEQNRPARQAHQLAAIGQRNDKLIAAGKVVPARITLAMNIGGHEGPEVDVACGTWEGNPAGDVDGWELGETTPTEEQVEKMAALTGFDKAWFYRPMEPGPLLGRDGEPGFVWMCGPRGCTVVKSDWVDERGVLHYGDDDSDRQPRKVVQGALPIHVEPAEKKPRQPAGRRTPAKASPEQPTLPAATRMPEHLRGPLMAHLEARKKR